MKTVRRVVLVSVFVGLLYAGWRFAHGNGQVIRVDFVVGRSAEMALWKALISSAGLGAIMTSTFLGFSLARSRLESRRYRKALMKAESEVHQLRHLPVGVGDPPDSGTASAVAIEEETPSEKV